MTVIEISSRDNPFVKDLRRLLQDSTGYRRQGRVWLEGEHLCQAYRQRGLVADIAVVAQSLWPARAVEFERSARRCVVLQDRLLRDISPLESPAQIGLVVALPEAPTLAAQQASVVLDRVQDAGNVGAILRSAAAFGFRQVLAIKGTAGLWSPKVLRAGMGAHFGLHLIEGLEYADLQDLQLPLLVTSSHGGEWVHRARLPEPCAWVLGHEGQGVAPQLEAMAASQLRIAQPGGEESLNVAVAAGICLHASAVARLG